MSIKAMNGRVFFNNYNINASHYIYDNTGATDPDIGWVRSRYDHVVVQVGVPTLTRSNGVEFRIEGKFTTMDRIASVKHITLSGALDIDQFHEISQRFEYIRVGARAGVGLLNATQLAASPVQLYAGVCLTAIGR